MGQPAFVYRTEADGERSYIGKSEFEAPLAVKTTNAYLLKRKWHFVRVDRIEPATWSPQSDVVPTVYVSSAGSKAQAPRRSPRMVPRRGEIAPRTEGGNG